MATPAKVATWARRGERRDCGSGGARWLMRRGQLIAAWAAVGAASVAEQGLNCGETDVIWFADLGKLEVII